LLGIGGVCEKYGYTLTLIPPLNESVTEAVRNAAVDGLITMGMQVDMDIVSVMKTRLIPYVTIDGTPDEDMPSVNIDDEMASYELMRTVLESGHRNICIISLGQDIFAEKATKMSLPQRRMEGFRKALEEVGIPLEEVPILVSEPTLADGKLRGKEILAFEKRPTCVVSMSDIVAIGCIVSWNEAGLSVPTDISIAGFDNIDGASCISPHLTTVDQPAQEKGRLAAEALFNMINKETLQSVHIQMPYTLIRRDSVKNLTSEQP
jgi:DNA-binding LacI/PurR family transcriptional regulator